MAESGANNEVRIKVVLDSAEAQARLAEIKAAMDALNSQIYGTSSNGSSGSNNNGVGGATTKTTTTSIVNQVHANNGNKEHANINDPKGNGAKFGNAVVDILLSNAKSFGFAAGLAFVSKAMDLKYSIESWNKEVEFAQRRSGEEGNTALDRDEAKWAGRGRGMSTWGKWGAVIGGGAMTLAGLAGALFTGGTSLALSGAGLGIMATAGALGAGGGYLAGQIAGKDKGEEQAEEKFEQLQRIRKEGIVQQQKLNATQTNISLQSQIGEAAFSKALKYAGSREGRIEQYRSALQELEYGDGESSISNLKRNRDRMLKSKNFDPNSTEWKENEMKLSQQRSKWSQLQYGLFEQEYLQNQPKPYEGSDFADSMTAKGLYVGGQVDVGKANQPIIDHLAEIQKMLMDYIPKALDKLGEKDGKIEDAGFTFNPTKNIGRYK